ncbi:NACHT domain-containing protein [Embleya sp. NPDC001921]
MHRATWPLHAAYPSLELATAQKERPGRRRRDRWAGAEAEHVPSMAVERAERALIGRTRVLLRGHAGGGKTTLLQWSAVSAACGKVPADLVGWRGRIPFLLPLRTLLRHGPGPDTPSFTRHGSSRHPTGSDPSHVGQRSTRHGHLGRFGVGVSGRCRITRPTRRFAAARHATTTEVPPVPSTRNEHRARDPTRFRFTTEKPAPRAGSPATPDTPVGTFRNAHGGRQRDSAIHTNAARCVTARHDHPTRAGRSIAAGHDGSPPGRQRRVG